MFPVLLRLGPITVYTYGFFLSLGIIIAVFVFWQGALKQGFKEERIFDLSFLTVLGAIIGGRFSYALVHPFYFLGSHFWGLFKFWQAGSVWYGALISGFVVSYLFIRREGWSPIKIYDLVAFSLPLGQFFGYLGIFLGVGGEAVFLVQSLLFLGFGAAIIHGRRRELLGKLVPAFLYLAFSSLTIFISSFFIKGRYFLGPLDLNQYASAVLFLLAVVGLRGRLKMNLPKDILNQVKNLLKKRERDLEKEEKKLKKRDPLLRPGRTVENAEFVEDAEETIGHERVQASRDILKLARSQVVKALYRLRKGKYGICEKCKKPIDPARLRAVPEATLCADCASKEEVKESPQKGVRRIS